MSMVQSHLVAALHEPGPTCSHDQSWGCNPRWCLPAYISGVDLSD